MEVWRNKYSKMNYNNVVMAVPRKKRRNLKGIVLGLGMLAGLSLIHDNLSLEQRVDDFVEYDVEEAPLPEFFKSVYVDHPELIEYKEIIDAKAYEYGFDSELVARIVWQESKGNVKARSKKGALGLMQLMPSVIKMYDVKDPYDPAENIDAGLRHLRWLTDKFGGNVVQGLAAYNAGQRVVVKALKKGTGRPEVKVVFDTMKQYFYNGYEVDPNRLPGQTRHYLKKILEYPGD